MVAPFSLDPAWRRLGQGPVRAALVVMVGLPGRRPRFKGLTAGSGLTIDMWGGRRLGKDDLRALDAAAEQDRQAASASDRTQFECPSYVVDHPRAKHELVAVDAVHCDVESTVGPRARQQDHPD